MGEFKAYLMGVDGRLRAWLVGGSFFNRLMNAVAGLKVRDGALTIPQRGRYLILPKAYFRVGIKKAWTLGLTERETFALWWDEGDVEPQIRVPGGPPSGGLDTANVLAALSESEHMRRMFSRPQVPWMVIVAFVFLALLAVGLVFR